MVTMKEWNEFYDQVHKCQAKLAKEELGITEKTENIDEKQVLELMRLYFHCYHQTLGKAGVARFDRLVEELFSGLERSFEKIGERLFKYQMKFIDPRILLDIREAERKIDAVVLEEIDEVLNSEDSRLLARMYIISFYNNIVHQALLQKLSPFLDILSLSEQTLGLDIEWVCALIAVVLDEALVKEKLRELGFEPKRTDSFHKLMQELVSCIKKENIRPQMDVFLTEGFRNVRHEIVHDPTRWKPSEDEVNTIIHHTMELAKGLEISKTIE